MEQINQQVIQKAPFPIKTKIAVWWMIIAAILFFLISLAGLKQLAPLMSIENTREGVFANLPPDMIISSLKEILEITFFGLFTSVSSFLLFLLRKRWAWIISIIIQLAFLVFCLFFISSIFIANNATSAYTFIPIYPEPIYAFLPFTFSFILLIIPFILLFLDRKNFFKIAS